MVVEELIAAVGGSESTQGIILKTIIEFFISIMPLLLFTIGIVLYSIFIFKFYRFIGRRDILDADEDDHWAIKNIFGKLAEISSNAVQNLIFIPILVFFWFAVFSLLLILLSKNHTPDTLMVTAMSIVAAVRITSYYSESLSKDLAKLIPLALLAVLVTDVSFFSYERSLALASQIPNHFMQVLNYMVFVVLLEFVMRIYEFFVKHGRNRVTKSENDEDLDA